MIKSIAFENLVKRSEIPTKTLKHNFEKLCFKSVGENKTQIYKFGKEADLSLVNGHCVFQNGELC